MKQETLQSPAGLWKPESEVNWQYWLGIVLQGRWWIMGGLLIGLILGVINSQLATPIYQSDALLQFESNKVANATIQMSGVLEDKSSTATEIEIIRSRMVLGKTIEDLGLDIQVHPHFFPVIGRWLARDASAGDLSKPALFGFRHFAWGGELVEVGQFDMPTSWRGRGFLMQTLAGGKYRLKPPGGSWSRPYGVGESLIISTVDGDVAFFLRTLQARPGTEFTLVRQPVDTLIGGLQSQLSLSERGKSTGLLDLRFNDPDPIAAQRILTGIANNFLRQNVERKSAEADQTLKFLDVQLPDLKSQLDAAESNFNAFRATNRTLNVTAEGESLLQRSVQTQTALGMLQQRRKELMQRFTAEHPMIRGIDGQLAALQGQVSQADGQVGSLPKLEQRMLQLMRDVKVANELYVGLLNNAQQLKVAKAGTVGNARIIDSASLPRGPISPQKNKILFMYVLLGMSVGVAIVLVMQLLKPGIKDARAIEQALGLPVYATVPRADAALAPSRRRKHSSLLSVADSQDPAVESLRSLRTALQFAALEATNQAMLIAGPAPNVGKSFISANLGVVLAQSGQRVVIIDADMRRGHLHDFFDIADRQNGLSDYLAGRLSLADVLQVTEVENVQLITTGAIPPNPSELLLHPRFDLLVRELCEQFDQVIFDSGPLLAVTDGAIIGRAVGTTLLVGRYEQTPLRELELAAQRLQQAGINLRGIVFNDVQKHGAYGYGYGYGYQYSYSYRSHEGKQEGSS
ncbi:MAG: polysaccharide biosynthesis tyrosine autokinase [Pseudomonadota bacterium]